MHHGHRQGAGRLAATALAMVGLVGACGSTTGSAPASTSSGTPTAAPTAAQSTAAKGEAELEIISPWTSGGENAALTALVAVYNQQYPNVKFVNAAVGGGGNTAADPLKLTRLQAGNPPDIWQAHGGADLFINYVKPGYAADLTSLWTAEGWDKVAPKALMDVLSQNGKTYAVPFGIHRVNMLWYNKKLLDANGVSLTDDTTLDQFMASADKLKAAGVTPLCLGDKDPWTSNTIFEDALLGTLTVDQYNGLWSGTTKFDDPAVKKAVDAYGKLLGYANSDHAALTWDQATQKVIEGSCAATLMGDWAYGEFLKANLKDNVDFGWIASPGSKGAFDVNNDLALTSSKSPDPVNSQNFLRVVGGVDGQVAFNKLKGSIPWRTDAPAASFPPYQQYSIKAYASLALVASEAQGLAAPPAFEAAVNDAVTQFGVDKNTDAFVKALLAASPQLTQ
jgi:glucose/mannose transport system substrate-binding protein